MRNPIQNAPLAFAPQSGLVGKTRLHPDDHSLKHASEDAGDLPCLQLGSIRLVESLHSILASRNGWHLIRCLFLFLQATKSLGQSREVAR